MNIALRLFATIMLAGGMLPTVASNATVVPAKSALTQSSIKHRVTAAAPASSNSVADEELYKVTMLLEEDFSKFTKGSEDAPDTEMIDGYVPNDLTKTPGWSGYYAYQAGGCVLVDNPGSDGNISTPIIEIPNNGKPLVITFRARLADPTFESDWAEVYMAELTTDNTGAPAAKVFYNDYGRAYSDWRDYRFEFKKERKATQYFFQFHGYDAKIFVDDIEIKFLDPKVEAPLATAYTNFSTTGFTANWEAVDGADSYLVSLYTVNKDKSRNYIVTDRKVEGLSTDFDGLDTPSNVYYYVVKAVKGSDLSPESNATRIHDLIIPGSMVSANGGERNIKVSWDAVPGAQYYEVQAYRTYTAKEDESFVLLRESFDGLHSEGTIDNPFEELPEQEELDAYTEQPGWIATYPAHINGAYCIIGYFYQTYGKQVFMESPICDMSGGNGTIKVSVDLYTRAVYQTDKCTAILRLMNLEDNKLTTASSKETEKIPSEWTTCTAELTGGTENSVLNIRSNDGWLYIDNILVTQDIKKGETVRAPYVETKSDKNEIEIPVNDLLEGQALTVRVRAVKEVWDEYGFSCDEYVRSPYTEFLVHEVEAAGIEGVEIDANAPVDVYNLQGMRVRSQILPEQIDELPAGIYIVGGRKVAVK